MPRGAGRSAGHRRTLLTLALLAGSTAWPLGPAVAQDTLPPAVAAVIDYQRILRDARAARAIRDQVEARRKLYQDEIAKEEQRLHEADKELARQRSVLSADAFADQRSEFESDVAGVQRMAQERRRQLDQAAAAALSEVRTAMIQVVGELAETSRLQSRVAEQRAPAVLAEDRSDRRGAGAAGPEAAQYQGARKGRYDAGRLAVLAS